MYMQDVEPSAQGLTTFTRFWPDLRRLADL